MQTQAGHLAFSVRSGVIQIGWDEDGLLTRVLLSTDVHSVKKEIVAPDWIPKRAFQLIEDLLEYFERGKPFHRISWGDLSVSQWTDFQKKVYEATSQIPHGETRTYGWVAQKIGKTFACRAVGQALRKNPMPLLIPCHRVVSNQSLGGFMGEDDPSAPSIGLKKQLLELEHDFLNPVFSFAAMGMGKPA
jgi:methylated-DNA-[protein]-cysteine S-methyltransferase